MINYGKMTSKVQPPKVQITDTMVFVANNIQSSEKDYEGVIIPSYSYDYVGYTKDEYLTLQAQAISNLEDELQAAKILLGVE